MLGFQGGYINPKLQVFCHDLFRGHLFRGKVKNTSVQEGHFFMGIFYREGYYITNPNNALFGGKNPSKVPIYFANSLIPPQNGSHFMTPEKSGKKSSQNPTVSPPLSEAPCQTFRFSCSKSRRAHVARKDVNLIEKKTGHQ